MDEIKHEHLKSLIVPYVLSALAAEEIAAVRPHLRSCEECTAEADGYSEVSDSLANPHGIAPSITGRCRQRVGRVVQSRFVMAIVGGAGLLRLLASLSLVGAGVIHMIQIEAHSEWATAGLFFTVVAALQLVFGAVVLFNRSPWAAAAPLALSVFVTAVWALSRTTGIPFGPHAGVPEAVGLTDVISTGFQVITTGALTMLLVGRRIVRPFITRRAVLFRGATSLAAFVIMVSLTAFAVAPSAGCEHRHATASASADNPLTPLEMLQQHADHDPYRLNVSNTDHGDSSKDHGEPSGSSATCETDH